MDEESLDLPHYRGNYYATDGVQSAHLSNFVVYKCQQFQIMEQKAQFSALCQGEFPRLSHRRAWPTRTQAPDSGWQRRAWKATRRTCLAATCKLRKGKSLTSLPSSARQQPREVQALWFPQPISLSTPPPPPGGMKSDPTLIKPHLNAPNKPRYISERLAGKPLAVVS